MGRVLIPRLNLTDKPEEKSIFAEPLEIESLNFKVIFCRLKVCFAQSALSVPDKSLTNLPPGSFALVNVLFRLMGLNSSLLSLGLKPSGL
jgi:hypothetical protein